RTLHTIGFRGIGFKSTFSLGDCVELFTPTLAVCFYRNHFSEPCWLAQQTTTDGKTRIRIQMRDHIQTEVETNFKQWLTSPLSLLFCRNIRQLRIGDRDVHWVSLRPGPIPDSKWMVLSGQKDSEFLLIDSPPEDFPEEALQEIKEERSLTVGEQLDFPPCKVEIVLGAKGQLFVVLPTGVETDLPFACNAPFIQDPARLKIKDPETSPTNRWLLERVGRLAASAMLRWLGMAELSTTERSQAYQLLPNFTWNDRATVGGLCSITIRQAFEQTTEGKPVLLTDDGNLVGARESIIIPNEIHAIWPTQQPSRFLDDKSRPALCQYVAEAHWRNLLRWGVVEEINKEKFLDILQSIQLPTPRPWQNLMSLWIYIAREITDFFNSYKAINARIIPVQGSDVLYTAIEVARLDGKKLVQSVGDWEFLTTRLKVMDGGWLHFLTEQRQVAADRSNATVQQDIEAAEAILRAARLNEASNTRTVIDRVALHVFSAENSSLQDFVRLAQIAAKLDAAVGDSFVYITVDESRRLVKEHVLCDADGSLRELLPKERLATDLLHPAYVETFFSCSKEDWQNWVSSGHAHLLTFAPFVQQEIPVSSWTLEDEARKRGLMGALSRPYTSEHFVIKEWDFERVYWDHWRAVAVNDDHLWTKVAKRILSQHDFRWTREKHADLCQVARTGKKKLMTNEPLLQTWALELRKLPCLLDTRGIPHKPHDLLQRTPETEMLIDVEPFVDKHLDTEAARPFLDLLGVRTTPAGPDHILDCLREQTKAVTPAISDTGKWYRGLDRMIESCSPADLERIKQTLWSEKLILTQDREWTAGSAVCLALDENGVPGAPVIHSTVSDLLLWRKIGIAERPTLDLALQWLNDLPSGQVLSPDTARRVRLLCRRYPVQIWDQCQHWLNLVGEWTAIKGLSYALTKQPPIHWENLHTWIKQKTADWQELSDAVR
ncbi:MAG: ATPase, partial [Anaerolineae bacterium]